MKSSECMARLANCCSLGMNWKFRWTCLGQQSGCLDSRCRTLPKTPRAARHRWSDGIPPDVGKELGPEGPSSRPVSERLGQAAEPSQVVEIGVRSEVVVMDLPIGNGLRATSRMRRRRRRSRTRRRRRRVHMSNNR